MSPSHRLCGWVACVETDLRRNDALQLPEVVRLNNSLKFLCADVPDCTIMEHTIGTFLEFLQD